MAQNRYRSSFPQAQASEIDQGLRQYMLRVYNLMALALGLTGVVAYLVAQSPGLMEAIFMSPLRWVVLLAPLGIVFFLSARIHRMPASTAQTVFWIYAASVGVSFASFFAIYEGMSIARVFFITASVFGSMSLYGYTTQRDLSGFGHFLFMGLIGLVMASLVNLFMQSSAMHFVLSLVGVLVFTGLTAYDTQNIKEMYFESDDHEVAHKKAIFGALHLYLNFINIFVYLLQIFGVRRSD